MLPCVLPRSYWHPHAKQPTNRSVLWSWTTFWRLFRQKKFITPSYNARRFLESNLIRYNQLHVWIVNMKYSSHWQIYKSKLLTNLNVSLQNCRLFYVSKSRQRNVKTRRRENFAAYIHFGTWHCLAFRG